MCVSVDSALAQVSRREEHQLDAGPGIGIIISYLALKDNYTIALQAAVSGESKGKDTFGGVPDDDSAETIVSAGP